MTKDEQYAFTIAKLIPRINTWEDIYTFFAEVMNGVTTTMHPAMVFDALFTMYAFINALKELPEEGDIKVIATRMVHILIYEAEEKLGARVTVMTGEEVEERVRQTVADAILSTLVDDDGSPRTVH